MKWTTDSFFFVFPLNVAAKAFVLYSIAASCLLALWSTLNMFSISSTWCNAREYKQIFWFYGIAVQNCDSYVIALIAGYIFLIILSGVAIAVAIYLGDGLDQGISHEHLKPTVLLTFACIIILLHQNIIREFNIILLVFLIIHVYFFICLYSLFIKLRNYQNLSKVINTQMSATYHI